MLSDLKKITDLYDLGPYILNDQQWQQSNVFFRYGGFRFVSKIIDGREVFCIKDSQGEFVEDKRIPEYYLPSFIKEPSFVVRNNFFPNDSEFNKINNLHIEEALHFSNAGGVYLGEKDGQRVVVKEGRDQAGIDANGKDGFFRIKNEYLILQKLRGIEGIINVDDYFVAWHNNYFVEELLDGENLHEFVARSFPYNTNDNVTGTTLEYANVCVEIIEQLKRIVDRVHSERICLGDLSLNNVMVSKRNNGDIQVTIIDLETAKPINFPDQGTALYTPGFHSDEAKTIEEGDWFSFYQIAKKLFLPINSVNEIAPDLQSTQMHIIEQKFGKEIIIFLNELTDYVFKYTNPFPKSKRISAILHSPKDMLSEKNVYNYKDKLIYGILNNLEFESFKLTSGDIRQSQSSLGKYNAAYGSFGVLLSLSRAMDKKTLFEKTPLQDWLNAITPYIEKKSMNNSIDIGLFEGLPGIATSLYEIGYKESACTIAESIIPDIEGLDDISIFSGLAGLGLFYLSFYQVLGKNKYRKQIDRIFSRLIFLYKDKNNRHEHDYGFLTGWTGVSLFLWKYYLRFGDEIAKNTSLEILDGALGYLSPANRRDDSLYILDTENASTVIPYLENGSTGIGLLMLEMFKDNSHILQSDRISILKKIIKSNSVLCSYNGGLISGYAGLLTLTNAAASLSLDNDTYKINLKGLNNFIISSSEKDFLFPGDYGFKCSMDLATGAAGVVSILNDVGSKRWGSWMPVLLEKNSLFNNAFNQGVSG